MNVVPPVFTILLVVFGVLMAAPFPVVAIWKAMDGKALWKKVVVSVAMVGIVLFWTFQAANFLAGKR